MIILGIDPGQKMKPQQFFIPYVFPSMNKVIDNTKQHWAKYSKKKKLYQEKVCWVIRAVKLKPMGSVNIELQWHEKNRRRDPDNIGGFGRKVIIDALVDMGIIKTDGWAGVGKITEDHQIAKLGYPGVMVTLENGRELKGR